MFEINFRKELSAIVTDNTLVEDLCIEIRERYSEPHRYYHTIHHLDALVAELLPIKAKIHDWQLLVFSIAYHDIIYNPSKSNNEEESAKLACSRLNELHLDENRKQKCRQQILATKKHEWSEDSDTNYFTDADLAILGTENEKYQEYSRQIRKEYKIYPDFLYRPGRRRVLQHFLDMPFIYKTGYFREKYESLARQNLLNELSDFQ